MLRISGTAGICKGTVFGVAIVVAAAAGSRAGDADDGPPPRPRAAPPDWPRDVVDAFFRDAREQLVGERPRPTEAPEADDRRPAAGQPQDSPRDGLAQWSAWIDEAALTTEVKRIHNNLRAPLANPSKFKAGGYLLCQRDYSVLAVWMAIIAEHPDQVRWHDQASLLAMRFRAAAKACETPSDESYKAAAAAIIDLEEIIRGGRLAGETPRTRLAWPDLAERRHLMQRMETALETAIEEAVANPATFRRDADQVAHEAQLVAALGEVIGQAPYEYADDPAFTAMTKDLRDAAQTLTKAARDNEHQAAVAAVSRMKQSCSDCHAGYR